MFTNYLKIALRNLLINKSYSLINITGLAIGMAVCIIIFLYILDELGYDKYHEYADRIYRIESHYLNPDRSVKTPWATLAPSFAPTLENDFPEFGHIVRLIRRNRSIVSVGDQSFIEERFCWAEHDVFDVFTIPLIMGDPQTALKNPHSIVLSQTMARKYFADENPIGRQIELDYENLFQVTAIMKDVPRNSHFHFDFLASYITLKGRHGQDENDFFFGTQNFENNVCATYCRIKEGVDIKSIKERIPDFLNRHMNSWKNDSGEVIHPSARYKLNFTRVPDIHLYSHSVGEFEPGGDIRYVLTFAIIGIFVLVIACVNFINLSTARATKRAKEVGLRKVIGANRRLLIFQFMGESLFITLLALFFAIVLVEAVLPYLNASLAYDLNLNVLINPTQLLTLTGVFLFVAITAGLYPSFYISAFAPSRILRGEFTHGRKGTSLRRAMVVFQFVISVGLIICVGIIFRQVQYFRNADLGFGKENIILIPTDREIKARWREVKQSLLLHQNILAVTASKRTPSDRLGDAPGFRTEVNDKVVTDLSVDLWHNRIEHDFFKTYAIEIIAGRDFSLEHATDGTEGFILNESAVKKLGWSKPEQTVGAPFYAYGRRGKIIGVVRDFNYESLHHPIEPILSYIAFGEVNTISLRIGTGDIRETVHYMENIWNEFVPGLPFRFTFLDQRIDQLYSNEKQMMRMLGIFSVLAIFIAALGLFGLATYNIERRVKEIGIRKVFGASTANVFITLANEFTRWILYANLIAWPIAWVVMNKWLQNFAYRISISWWIFAGAGILALTIALLTVIWQAIKAALANPVESLKYE